MVKLEVKRARGEDVFGDRFRLNAKFRKDSSGSLITAGAICWILVGNRKALAVARGLPTAEGATIRLDDALRKRLAVTDGDRLDFEFRLAGTVGALRWAWSATEPGYRVSARLAALSVVLGTVGLALGIISLF